MATSILDLVKHVQEQGDLGRARGKQSALAKLASQAYSAPHAQQSQFVQQAIGVDPDAGFALGKQMHAADDERNQRIVRAAKMLVALPEHARPGYFRQMAPDLRMAGLQVDDNYLPEYGEVAQKIVDAWGGPEEGVPAQQRYAEWLLSQAPADQRDQVLGVLGGYRARPASGGYGFEEIEGADGRKRISRRNPRNGVVEVYDESTGEFMPMGNGGTQPQSGVTLGQPMPFTIGADVPPEVAAQIRAQEEAAGSVYAGQPLPPPLDYQGGGYGAGNPALGVSRRPEDEAAAKKDAEEAARLRYAQQFQDIETQGAIDTARGKSQAEAQVELAGKRREKQTAYDQYVAAMAGVESSLKNTTTNPVAGSFPALTARQQIAEGAVAASAPVLKQLFRSAGEGVFTDKDQELLIAMLPTRKDHPEARKAKLAHIDAIVRAKLGIPPAGTAPVPSRSAQPSQFPGFRLIED